MYRKFENSYSIVPLLRGVTSSDVIDTAESVLAVSMTPQNQSFFFKKKELLLHFSRFKFSCSLDSKAKIWWVIDIAKSDSAELDYG